MKNNKVVLYIAMSLDCYIARLDGSVDWLMDVEGDGGDSGYGEFYKSVGTVVMGRLTYDEVLLLADDFPYADKPCYVLSRSKQTPAPHVTFTDEALTTYSKVKTHIRRRCMACRRRTTCSSFFRGEFVRRTSNHHHSEGTWTRYPPVSTRNRA